MSYCQARDTYIIQDESGSMGYADFRPNRLTGGKEAAITYVKVRTALSAQDRIALIGFDTEARVVLPLISIQKIDKIIEAISRFAVQGGTDIAVGLTAVLKLLQPLSRLKTELTAIFNPSRLIWGAEENDVQRENRILLLTDGRGGCPLRVAEKLKTQHEVIIDVVGIGGRREEVDELLLKEVATTDHEGNHYRFIGDAQTLKDHYQTLATGLCYDAIRSL